MKITSEEQNLKSANEVFKQLNDDSKLEIALDPELADFMGAFEENAMNLEDIRNSEDLGSGNNE